MARGFLGRPEPRMAPDKGQERSSGGPLQASFQKPVPGSGTGRRPLGRADSCPHRPAVHGARGQAVSQHPHLLESESAARTYGDGPGQRWGPLGSRQCRHAPGSSMLQQYRSHRCQISGDLSGVTRGSPSVRATWEIFQVTAPTRSLSPRCAEFPGVTCWAGSVPVHTAKRFPP